MDERVGVALITACNVQPMVAIEAVPGAIAAHAARAAATSSASAKRTETGDAAGGDADAEAYEGGVAEDDGPAWPDEATESAMLVEQRGRADSEPVAATAATRKKTDDDEPETMRSALPPLDELVARVPTDVRDTLEELFRAKFVRVSKVPKAVLKAEQG